MGFLSKCKLCRGKADVVDPISAAKQLFCNEGKSAVEADPDEATKLLKSTQTFLRKSGRSEEAQSLAEMCEKPVEKFEDTKKLLEKLPDS
mmetsp:Transcript_36951/g.66003  ORF Transcript_36951/g.66003 Transcript_36951/m.66003 type:complete len:90 (-) Transcript_36951:116-385(-)